MTALWASTAHAGEEDRGYCARLDGLRTVAVALVVAIHSIENLSPALTHRVLPGGFLGVDLFFVLSGFLITRLLLGESLHGASIGRFYARRALRLLPALAVVLAAHAMLAPVIHVSASQEATSIVLVVGYVANWTYVLGRTPALGLGHMWSLAVEEQFYLVWPFLLMTIRRFSGRAQLCLVLGSLAVSSIACARAWSVHPGWRPLYVRTDLRATTILAGAALALVWERGRPSPWLLRLASWLAWLLFGTAVLNLRIDHAALYQGGFLVVAVACTGMVAGAVSGAGPFGRLLASTPFVYVGRRSYGLYLWHLPVIAAIATFGRSWPPPIRIAVAAAGALSASALSYRFVESPFLRIKDRLLRVDRYLPVRPAVEALPAS